MGRWYLAAVSPMRSLRSGALALEPQSREHAEQMFALLSDPALYAFEGAPPDSLEVLRARFVRLESRTSADGGQQWLNWVVLHDDDGPIGYVQATVMPAGDALIAYVIGSAWWGRGYASQAVEAMAGELARSFGVHTLWAVFKTANGRSRRLLERLGFEPLGDVPHRLAGVLPDESVMRRRA